MNERELIIRAKSGDKEAFCTLYTLYKDRLYRYAHYRLGNPYDAEDAVSDCIASAYAQINKLKKPEAFAAWIFRILYCCCNSIIKLQSNGRETADISGFENVLTTDMQQAVDKTELAEALGTLKDDEREIVLLSAVFGLSSKEIARITDMTSGAVRSKLSRSLAKLRGFLQQ